MVDATGLLCPIPVLRLEKALRGIPVGEEIVLQATDPAAHQDVEVFCRERGHALVEVTNECGVLRFVVRRNV